MDLQNKRAIFTDFDLDSADRLDGDDGNEIEVPRLESESQRGEVSNKETPKRTFQDAKVLRQRLKRCKEVPLRPTVSFTEGSGPKNVNVRSRKSASFSDSLPATKEDVCLPSHDNKSTGKNLSKTISGRGTKRKREKSVELVSESRQVLKDFHFYFIPNNDINPVRKVQIRNAIKYGATWVRDWSESITHVIADQDLLYDEVKKWINQNCVDPIPDDITMVNPTYQVHCIQFQFKVNPRQPHYYIKGYKPSVHSESAATPAPQIQPFQSSESNKDTTNSRPTTVAGHGLEDDDPLIAPQDSVVESRCQRTPESSWSTVARSYNDDLSRAIEEAQATKDLPLDFVDEEESPSSSFDIGDDESEGEQRQKPKPKKRLFIKPGQSGFSCMTKNDGTGKTKNPNASTIEVLEKMADVYEKSRDQWRPLAYRRAISQLKKQEQKIVTAEQAEALPFVGRRLALKIQEIATTNRLRRLDNAMQEPEEKALQAFLGIYGVGVSQAQHWVQQGHRSLQDLAANNVPMSKNQQIGIEHYRDFNLRIPRSEMTQHDDYVRKIASRLDPELQLTIGGSFRRGAESSGDIDFIVTKLNSTASTVATIMLDRVIPALWKTDYLKAGLATGSNRDGHSGSKWHGACALLDTDANANDEIVPAPWRRIDFLFVPWDEIGAALLYFTGNDIFNRSIRLLAGKKSMRLNQRGLFKDVMRGPRRARLTQGTLVEGKDERKIFEALGVPWREPWERIC